MKDNDLLMIILAFVSGFMLQGMMKNMCGGLVEGVSNQSCFLGDMSCTKDGEYCYPDPDEFFGSGCRKPDHDFKGNCVQNC
jgi:hypothetical protein